MTFTGSTSSKHIGVGAAILLCLVGVGAALSAGWFTLPLPLSVVAMLLAWVKGVVVVEYFMELRHAPYLLRGVVHAWLSLTCMGLVMSSWV